MATVEDLYDELFRLGQIIERQCEEMCELRREAFDQAAKIAIKDNLIAALEDVIRATAQLREKA